MIPEYAAKHKGFLPAVKNCLYGPSVAGQPLPVAVGPRSLDCPAAGVALFLLTVAIVVAPFFRIFGVDIGVIDF